MSHPIFLSKLLIELSNQQQELVAGGADFELAGSNFAKRLVNLQGLAFSGPNGSTANSIGTSATINTAAQDFLALGAPSIPTVGALGSAPGSNGAAESPVGIQNATSGSSPAGIGGNRLPKLH
ncbi:CTB family bacteriocin [Nostoc sp. FACHB-280]|uniref:CTB family bacteriocin n=1 Tax=Nostoc sp. FACHB-280 TaxID=2692839 RepID=UPI00168B153D|nr:CTB family bacteriocin [Nostoc sp. FACHB-280]